MSKIVFVGEPGTVYDGTISKIDAHQISIVFDNEVPTDEVVTSGFNVVNEYNYVSQGNYRGYNHMFRKNPNGVVQEYWLSDDMSEYIPPTFEDETGVIDTTPKNIREASLTDIIAAKKEDFAASCRTTIENGVDVVIDGVSEHFSYSLIGGDQTNIDDIFNIMMTTGLGQYYHCDGGSCKMYTPMQIFEIYAAQKINKLKQTTFYNQLVIMTMTNYSHLDDTEENRKLVASLVYGTPEEVLYGNYLTTYQNIVTDNFNMLSAMRYQVEKMLGIADE